MRTVTPLATLTLPTRARSAARWARGWVIHAAPTDALVLDDELIVQARVTLPAEPFDLAALADGSLVIATPRCLASSTWRVDGHFCAVLTEEDSVWAVEHAGEGLELSRRDPATGAVVATYSFEDPFGDSGVMLLPGPVLWIGAGTNGQVAHVVRDGELVTVPPPDCYPPVFLPDGASYLVTNDHVLEHRRWPSGDLIASLAQPDAGEDGPGSHLQLLPGPFASWSSDNGRIYVFDLSARHFVDELTIAGHPLLPAEALYPSLRGDRALCSDFQYARTGPRGRILTVHANTQLVVSNLCDWSPAPDRYPART